jgi:hypothetical protein
VPKLRRTTTKNDREVRRRLAGVLGELSAAVRTYGSLATEHDASRHELLESELERRLDAAQDRQDRLSELINHLDRLRNELRAGKPADRTLRRRLRSWRRPQQAGRHQPWSPTRRRLRR